MAEKTLEEFESETEALMKSIRRKSLPIVSGKHAAAIIGCHHDYIGPLVRSGELIGGTLPGGRDLFVVRRSAEKFAANPSEVGRPRGADRAQ